MVFERLKERKRRDEDSQINFLLIGVGFYWVKIFDNGR